MRPSSRVLGAALGVVALAAVGWWSWTDLRSDAWLSDDPATRLRLADALAERMRNGVDGLSIHTGDARFDGEWRLVACQMTVLSLGRLLDEHPDRRESWGPALERCTTWLAGPEARAFGTAAWGVDALEDPDPDHVHAYLGWTNTALAVAARHELPGAREATDRISAFLADRTRGRPLHELETYPGEVYPPDLSVVTASLAAHGGYDADAASLVARIRVEAIDPETGLLFQTLARGSGAPGRARGSGSALAAWFLGEVDPALSRQLSLAIHQRLRGSIAGFGGVREVPVGAPAAGDIDSGPVVFGLSVSASGFGLASARRLDDRAWHRELYRSASLVGLEAGGWFTTGGAMGNALLLAALTDPDGGGR